MNEAIFIDKQQKELPYQIEKIIEAQDNINDSLRDLHMNVGTVEFIKTENKYHATLVVDEDALEKSCEKIIKSAAEIKELYRELVEDGIFKKKSRL